MIIKQLYFHTYFPNEFEYLIKKAGDSPGINNVRERQQPGNILIEIVWKKTFFHFTWNFVHFVSNRTLKRWLAVLQNSFVQEIVYSVSQKFLFLDFAARKKNFIQVCSDLLEVTGYKNEPYHGHWIEMNQKSNLDFWLISILCHGRHETALLFPPASGWPMVCYNISNSTTLPNYHMVTIPPCMYKYVCTPASMNTQTKISWDKPCLLWYLYLTNKPYRLHAKACSASLCGLSSPRGGTCFASLAVHCASGGSTGAWAWVSSCAWRTRFGARAERCLAIPSLKFLADKLFHLIPLQIFFRFGVCALRIRK